MKEVVDLEKLLSELNKDLENKLIQNDIVRICNITNNFTESGKRELIDKNIQNNSNIYCIYLNDNVNFSKFMEYRKSCIKTDPFNYYLFYSPEYMELW